METKLTPLSPNEHGDSFVVDGYISDSRGVATPVATPADLDPEKPQGVSDGG